MKNTGYAVILLLSISLAGCKKDSPSTTDPVSQTLAQKIKGKWKWDKLVTEANGQTTTSNFTKNYKDFWNDGTLVSTFYNDQTQQTTTTETDYMVANETSFKTANGSIENIITTIDAHNLIYYTISGNSVKSTLYLSR